MLRLLTSAATPSAACLLRSSVASASVHAARRALQRGQGLGITALRESMAHVSIQQATRKLHSASSLPRAPQSTLVGSVSSLRAVGSSSSPLSLQLPWSARLSTLASLRPKQSTAVSIATIKSSLISIPSVSFHAARAPLASEPLPRGQSSAIWREVKSWSTRLGWRALRFYLVWLVAYVLWQLRKREELAAASLQHWDVDALIARGGLPLVLPPPIYLSYADRRAVDQALPWHLRFVSGKSWFESALAELIIRTCRLPPVPTLTELEANVATAKSVWTTPLLFVYYARENTARLKAAELLLDAPALWPVSDAVRMQAAREILEQAIPQALRILAYHQHHDVKLQPSDQSMWWTWAVLTKCYTRLGRPEELEQAARCMQRAVEREANKCSADAAFREQLQLAVDELTHDRLAQSAAAEGKWREFAYHSVWSADAGVERTFCEIETAVPDPLPSSIRLALCPSYGVRRQGLLRFYKSLCHHQLHDPNWALREVTLKWVRALTRDDLGYAALLGWLDDSSELGHRFAKRWNPDAPLPTPRISASGDPPTLKLDLSFGPECASARLKSVSRLTDYATLFHLAERVLRREGDETNAEQAGHIAHQLTALVHAMVEDARASAADDDY